MHAQRLRAPAGRTPQVAQVFQVFPKGQRLFLHGVQGPEHGVEKPGIDQTGSVRRLPRVRQEIGALFACRIDQPGPQFRSGAEIFAFGPQAEVEQIQPDL